MESSGRETKHPYRSSQFADVVPTFPSYHLLAHTCITIFFSLEQINYNRIHNSSSCEETTLTVCCIHEKTGAKLGSSDGLIGSCEIDLKQLLFSKESGQYEGWFQLMFDGKPAGQVHLRLQLCEPSPRFLGARVGVMGETGGRGRTQRPTFSTGP
ncbi:hypothetical protein BCR41DRAFT_348437 [Lobosporangium transversale]|uniref:Uncharacterized protein n=1 Tax=Lobosporangium transversale TaxID=64571 RepID=A0A1Y2GXL8_9FUNG|nr:hypothetical protein BCR41DRAFT_348437 [Lobosporangium transversale]ORZ26521.1 hypothetical protein BCR41DRAFT_348437 [Lobosporangium transversale]|eukprot:XP_021884286.1 hypothetical protein BCR41DRAFT_348437 [Lobosporangium transversale]